MSDILDDLATVLASKDAGSSLIKELHGLNDLRLAQPKRPAFITKAYVYAILPSGGVDATTRPPAAVTQRWIDEGLVVPWNPFADGKDYDTHSFDWYRLSDAAKAVVALLRSSS